MYIHNVACAEHLTKRKSEKKEEKIAFYLNIGPILDVMQYEANPWRERSKLLHTLRGTKISITSLLSIGKRFRD
jgi:hypothetical protein